MRSLIVSEGVRAGMNGDVLKDPISGLIKSIKSSKLQTEAKDIAVKHGFADIKDWFDTGRAVGQAYIYVTAGPSRGMAKQAIDTTKVNALKELEKLGLLTEAQKRQLKENLDALSEQLSREPPPQNVAVVQQMKPDIEAAMNFGFD
jgi:hypothetical protein